MTEVTQSHGMLELWKKTSEKKRAAKLSRARIDLTGLNEARVRLYVVPDIHGCLDELLDAEGRILDDMAGDRTPALIIYLGDYVDRGPRSADVLDHLIDTSLPGARRIMLCGNHDDLFLKVLTGRMDPREWVGLGGWETLASYGMTTGDIDRLSRSRSKLLEAARRLVRAEHVAFLRDLPVSVRIGQSYLFVHAGILPGRPLEHQSEEHMMWIREPFLSTGPKLPLTVVHGHTIVSEPVFAPGRISLDTGAYIYGRLDVLKIAGGKLGLI